MSIIEDLKLQYKIGGIVNRLIYWNIGLFLLSIVFFYKFKLGGFFYPEWLAISSDPTTVLFFPWTILTYAFFHNGFFHLFFNMMVFNFSSRLFLTYFTEKQFFGVYILGGMFAGLCYVLSYFLLDKFGVMVGASAAIMAVLMAVTTYQPLMEVRLLLIGNVKLWYITAVLLLLDLLQVQLDNSGGHISHLSGALFGYLYCKLLQNGTDLSKIVTAVLQFFTNLFNPKKTTPFKKVHVNSNKKNTNRESKIVSKDKRQQQIDEILDKISQSGYDSLTSEEKEFLFKAGK